MKNKPFLYIGILGVIVLLNAYWLKNTFPSKAPYMVEGFSTPITFFAFIQSPVELESFFGLDNYDFDSAAFIKRMDNGNKIDFIFALLYSVFFFLFFMKLAKISEKKWYKSGMLLAIIAFAADVMENVQLLQITSNLTNGIYEQNLDYLFIFTWIKWSSLAIGMALFGLWLIKLPGILRYMGYIAWLPIIFGFIAFLNRGVFTELFTRSINIMFFVGISYCFMFNKSMLEYIQDDEIMCSQ